MRVIAFKETGGPEVLRPTSRTAAATRSTRPAPAAYVFPLPDALRRHALSALELVASGDVRIDVTEEHGLEGAAEAHRSVGEGRSKGKVVLRVTS